MAEVSVNSWEEFLEAAAVEGDIVNCPVNGFWDLADIEPEGHSGAILLKATINGNGTTIKNLVIHDQSETLNGVFRVWATVTDLHFIDGVWGTPTYIVNFEASDAIVQLCTFSASCQGGSGVWFFYLSAGSKATVYRCASNLEFASCQTVIVLGGNVEGKYNNFKISGSHVTSIQMTILNGTYRNGKMEYSYCIFDTPALTAISGASFFWSVLRCTGANVTDLRYVGDGSGEKVTVGCSADFPNADQISAGLELCSEMQLKDATYLQSIGFPIGVEY